MSIDTLFIPPQLKVRRKTFLNDLVAGMIYGVVAIPNGLGWRLWR